MCVCVFQKQLKLVRSSEFVVRSPSLFFRMAVLSSSRDVLLCDADGDLSRCSFEGEKCEYMQPTCSSLDTNRGLNPLADLHIVNSQELLAVLCNRCKDITTLDLETGTKRIAYRCKQEPIAMCEGDSGKLWLFLEGGSIIELSCHGNEFSETGKTFEVHLENCGIYSSMCYLPSPQDALVVSDSNAVRAFNRKGERLWEMPSHFEGVRVDPCGLAFSAHHKVLMLADGDNHRLLKLDPQNGSVVKSFAFAELAQPFPLRLSWSGDHLVVLAGHVTKTLQFSEKTKAVLLWYEVDYGTTTESCHCF